jgi:hypothetical protein
VSSGLNHISSHIRVNGPVRPKAMLVRGKDIYSHFDQIDLPAAERDPAALAVQLAPTTTRRSDATPNGPDESRRSRRDRKRPDEMARDQMAILDLRRAGRRLTSVL